MGKWRNVVSDYPDWKDTGRAELKLKGKVVTGQLLASDYGFNGEDEYPIFSVELDDGTTVSISDFDEYRLTPPQSP